MFIEYIRTKEKAIVRDEKGMKPKENHSQIEEELILENEIEILVENIKRLEKGLAQLGTLENNRKRNIVNKITAPLMIVLAVLGIRIILHIAGMDNEIVGRGMVKSFSNALTLYFATPMALVFFGVNFLETHFRIKRDRAEIILYQEELEMLRTKLNQKEIELENIRQNKKTSEIIDEEAQQIDIKSYRVSLQKELEFLNNIIYYRKRYYELYQAGTLEITMQEEGYSKENIELAKKVLRRTLEK